MSVEHKRLLHATLVIGVGLMAALDEIVFHQWLAWHHFLDVGTSTFGIFSDGLLHAAELVALVAGFFLYADARRLARPDPGVGWAGLLLGAGGFQLFDGVVDHKVLRIHQVRYVSNLLPYDLAWNAFGVLLLLAGAALWWLSGQRDQMH
jgi:uncharacterized membrane protein